MTRMDWCEEEWRSASEGGLAPSAMTFGEVQKPQWPADNWDFPNMVGGIDSLVLQSLPADLVRCYGLHSPAFITHSAITAGGWSLGMRLGRCLILTWQF